MAQRNAITFILLVLLVGVGVLVLSGLFDDTAGGIDDANIYLVYARNLAHGHGLVYNLGGERVEGFTSLLWTLIASAAFVITPASPERLLLLLSIVLLAFGLAAACSFLRSSAFLTEPLGRRSDRLWPVLFAGLLLSNPSYLTWNTITLMENPLWSTLLLLTTLAALRNGHGSRQTYQIAVGVALLIVTRPESMAWVPVLIAASVCGRVADGGLRSSLRAVAVPAISAAVALATLTIFRQVYFGYPLPNTFYAKVSPSLIYNLTEGGRYLVRFVVSAPLPFLAALAAALGTLDVLRRRRLGEPGGALDALPFIAAAALLMPVLTGGDHFGSFRFYQSVYPLLVLNLLHTVAHVLPRYWTAQWRRTAPAASVAVSTAVLCLFLVPAVVLSYKRFPEVSRMTYEFEMVAAGRERAALANALLGDLPAPPSIGVLRAGAFGFGYRGPVIDLMGLNNTRMAHNRGRRIGTKNHAAFEKQTFYELAPQVVIPRLVDTASWRYEAQELRDSYDNRVMKRIFDDSQFLRNYDYAVFSRSGEHSDRALVAWIDKELAAWLEDSSAHHIERLEYPVLR